MANNEALGIGLGVMGGIANNALGMGNTRSLMDLQVQNQMKLNKQMQQIQLENWEKTNYLPQRQQMEKAGLNVGLMYGMGGGGGTTMGGGSGGSASGGNTPTYGIGLDPMTIANIKLTEAQTEKLKAETEKTSGVDTEKTKAEVQNLLSGNEGIKLDNQLKEGNLENALETALIMKNNFIKQGNKTDKEIVLMNQELSNKIAENAFIKAQTKLSNQHEKESIAKVQQGWRDLELKLKGLELQEAQQEIQKFTAETQRNYPSIMNSAGGVLNNGFKAIYRLFGMDYEETPEFKKVK